jgi:hypothetical protein
MTVSVVVMIIIGLILSIASFFISEKISKKEDSFNVDLLTVDENYEFSERELRIIRRKIEDVIANQAKDILYETNESLSNMANEKTLALGDYAVAVCEEIEKNHKEVMFLYSMLDDKQKEIMNTVKAVDEANREVKDTISKAQKHITVSVEDFKTGDGEKENPSEKKLSAIDQLTALSKKKKEMDSVQTHTGEPMQEQSMPETVSDEEIEKELTATEPSEEQNVNDMFAELDETELDFDEVLEEEFKDSENSNDIILEMHKKGSSIIDIAKQLGLGVGEVKLVIDLYQGE